MVNRLKLISMQVSEIIIEAENTSSNEIPWYNILNTFDFIYLLDKHDRLIRSQYFGDDDYEINVNNTISDALHDNKENATEMIKFIFRRYNIPQNKFNELFEIQENTRQNPEEICKTVFISYSNENKQYCSEIKNLLNQIGLYGFLAHEDINISREWEVEIFKQLKQSDIFIALLSEDFKKSDYCSQEVGMALQKEAMIIPLSIDGTESFGFLSKYQSKPYDYLAQIQEEIIKYYPNAMINILINHLNNYEFGWNYDKCNNILKLIKNIIYDFDKNQINEFVKVVINNNQLHGVDGKEILEEFYIIHMEDIPENLLPQFEDIIF